MFHLPPIFETGTGSGPRRTP